MNGILQETVEYLGAGIAPDKEHRKVLAVEIAKLATVEADALRLKNALEKIPNQVEAKLAEHSGVTVGKGWVISIMAQVVEEALKGK